MSLALHPAPALPTTDPAPLRVMVVDDAVVVRGLVSRWVAEQPGLAVVASLRTGRQAVDQLERADPDVVVLDVDMPELDGISALPLLLRKKRDLVVDHGFDADAAERGNQPAGAVARRRRLRSEARGRPRSLYVDGVSSRADR